MALHQVAHSPLTPKVVTSRWYSVLQAALKTALLTGLLLTGLVDEGAFASATASATAEASPDTVSAEAPLELVGPAMVELRIEGAEVSMTHILYFPPDSIDLTPQARLALLEIADEMSSIENPSISLSSQDGDRLLSFERINSVAGELERNGFNKTRLFTWSELDILTAREL